MNMRVPLQLGNFGIKITVSAFVQSSIWYNKEKILTLSAVQQLLMSYTSAPNVEKRKHANDTFNITQQISRLYKEMFQYESP